jgi:putative transposase
MADLKQTETNQAPGEVPVKEQTPDTREKTPKPSKRTGKQERAVRTRAVKSPPPASASKAVASPMIRTGRRIYSEKERAQKLGEIEKQIRRGASIKAAIQKAGISEQTYYQWKKPVGQTTQGDELKDLVMLEEENARLKNLLADRLRKENADLKKKLGLA